MPARAQKFILAWTALLIAGFALGANISLRYLLPASPLLAILIAGWLQAADAARLVFSARRLLAALLLVLVLLDATAAGLLFQLSAAPAAAALACGVFLFAIGAIAFGARRQVLPATVALGLAMVLGGLIFFVTLIPLTLPDRAQQIAATLQHGSQTSPEPVLLVGDVSLASRVRLLLGPDWRVTQADRLNPAEAANYTRILVPEKGAADYFNLGWKIKTAAVSYGVPSRAEFWNALKSRQLAAALARNGQIIYLATHE
jgi:4-amino-4-deoxy-L-arabinose transferase-like glycosyltransferase